MERILVGVDGSAPSLKAVDFAADLASKYGAELTRLIHEGRGFGWRR
jgi:nucleotide-binding universal stress UspA family protein